MLATPSPPRQLVGLGPRLQRHGRRSRECPTLLFCLWPHSSPLLAIPRGDLQTSTCPHDRRIEVGRVKVCKLAQLWATDVRCSDRRTSNEMSEKVKLSLLPSGAASAQSRAPSSSTWARHARLGCIRHARPKGCGRFPLGVTTGSAWSSLAGAALSSSSPAILEIAGNPSGYT